MRPVPRGVLTPWLGSRQSQAVLHRASCILTASNRAMLVSGLCLSPAELPGERGTTGELQSSPSFPSMLGYLPVLVISPCCGELGQRAAHCLRSDMMRHIPSSKPMGMSYCAGLTSARMQPH